VFLMAAVGAAVGLGNLWKFPYTAGVSGGAAFVLVYLVAVAAVAVPIVIAELMIGRRGRMSPPNSFIALAREAGAQPGLALRRLDEPAGGVPDPVLLQRGGRLGAGLRAENRRSGTSPARRPSRLPPSSARCSPRRAGSRCCTRCSWP
jgi:hypothetical protein